MGVGESEILPVMPSQCTAVNIPDSESQERRIGKKEEGIGVRGCVVPGGAVWESITLPFDCVTQLRLM